MTETKRCISCGFTIPDGEEKQYCNSETGGKVYFCKLCDSIFGKFVTEEECDDQ